MDRGIVGKSDKQKQMAAVCESLGPDYTHSDQLNYLTSSRWKTLNPRLLGPFTFTAQSNASSNITVYFLCMCYRLIKQGGKKGMILREEINF